jgi:hypothetical protein
MSDFNNWLQRLLQSQHITKSSLGQTTRQQGAYVLWLDEKEPICLKVGIAGPRRGKGLLGRLEFHFASRLSDSILAKHLAADSVSPWSHGYDFQDQQQRQKFLTDKCFFQVIPLLGLSRNELLQFEDFLEMRLKPKYAGMVTKGR